MEFFGKHRLVPHPEKQRVAVQSVDVEVHQRGESVVLRYSVEPADTLLLPAFGRERRDGLWQSTCFELFIRPERGGYVEFNFAPLEAWNAYSFTDWRMGKRPYQPDGEPRIADLRVGERKQSFPELYQLDVILSGDVTVLAPASASLTAVIEEEGGVISYWALAHPPGPPNFHHADCFVAALP
jgi:hypothetical protein